MKLEDVSNEYVECPICKVAIVSKGAEVDNNIKQYDKNTNKFFGLYEPGFKGNIDRQCPKCFKVWREVVNEN